jgi:hypothetical protein
MLLSQNLSLKKRSKIKAQKPQNLGDEIFTHPLVNKKTSVHLPPFLNL